MELEFGCNHLHEQYPPDVLLKFAALTEEAGFDNIYCDDHFHPFFHTTAHCGFPWVWMAAAGERTRRVKIGTAVTTPTLRYNPAIVAQAFATLAVMYPNRIFLSVGAGEAMNEIPVGIQWPSSTERVERIEEAIIVMKKLWRENFVTYNGKYYTVRKANLYTRPNNPISVFLAAGSGRTAEVAGRVADGIMVLNNNGPDMIQEKIFSALVRGLKSSGRDENSFTKICHFVMSYDEDYEKALSGCRLWAGGALPFVYQDEISDPREIEAHGRTVSDDELSKHFLIATSTEDWIKGIEEYVRIGIKSFNLSNISPDQEKFIHVAGKEVIPYLREQYKDG